MPTVELILGKSEEVLPTIADNSIDLTVTSPPYDGLRLYNGYSFDLEAIASELYRVTKIGGVVVWVVGDQTVNGSESGTSFRQALYFKEVGFNLHDTMIYRKENYIHLTHKRYEQEFEYMFVFSKGTPKTFNPIKRRNKQFGNAIKYGRPRKNDNHSLRIDSARTVMTNEFSIVGNIFSYVIGAGNEMTNHPATFPESLARDHILSWSNPNDTVLDCFLGSGTTGKMAVMYGRNFIGIEISSEYLEMARKRIENTERQPSLLPPEIIEPLQQASF